MSHSTRTREKYFEYKMQVSNSYFLYNIYTGLTDFEKLIKTITALYNFQLPLCHTTHCMYLETYRHQVRMRRNLLMPDSIVLVEFLSFVSSPYFHRAYNSQIFLVGPELITANNATTYRWKRNSTQLCTVPAYPVRATSVSL